MWGELVQVAAWWFRAALSAFSRKVRIFFVLAFLLSSAAPLESCDSFAGIPPQAAASPPSTERGDGLPADKENNAGPKTLVAPRRAKPRRGWNTPVWNQSQIEKLLSSFPDLSEVRDVRLENISVPTVPDELLRQIALRGKNVERLDLGVWGANAAVGIPTVSDQGMRYISQLKRLKRLNIACRFSANGFASLTELPDLEILGTYYCTLSAGEFFSVVGKMPKIRIISVVDADLSQPIDAATYKAIASLNGRLEELCFGEWQETTIDRSMLPAIAEIRSLTWLDMGSVEASYEDYAPIREKLRNLRHFSPHMAATKDIRIVDDPTSKK